MIVKLIGQLDDDIGTVIKSALGVIQLSCVTTLTIEFNGTEFVVWEDDTAELLLSRYNFCFNQKNEQRVTDYINERTADSDIFSGARISGDVSLLQKQGLLQPNSDGIMASMMSLCETERVRTLEIVRKFIKDELNITVECVENRVGVYLRLGTENFSDDFDYII